MTFNANTIHLVYKMKHKIIFLLLLCIQFSFEDTLDVEFVEAVLKEFDIKHPVIVNPDISKTNKLIKNIFKRRQFTNIVSNITDIEMTDEYQIDVLVLSFRANETTQHLENLFEYITGLVLILKGEDFDILYESLKVPMNKKVYLIKESTREAFETYQVKDQSVKRKLGMFGNLTNLFVWGDGIEKDFIERRSDFQGQTLRAMTENYGTEFIIDSNYRTTTRYFPQNETFLVTGKTSGIFNDILEAVEKQLNFTTESYKRKVEWWGNVFIQPNGSFKATGMVSDLCFERVDLVPDLGILAERAICLDYLLPLTSWDIGLYISSKGSENDFHFSLLLAPFR